MCIILNMLKKLHILDNIQGFHGTLKSLRSSYLNFKTMAIGISVQLSSSYSLMVRASAGLFRKRKVLFGEG